MANQESNESPGSVHCPVKKEFMIINQEDRRGQVLVVHDDSYLHRFLPTFSSMSGYQVIVSNDSHEALERYLTTPFDTVIADLHIPGSWTLACHIKKHFPKTPVVLITSQRREATLKIIKEANIDSVLFKPFVANDFLELVQKYVDEIIKGPYDEDGVRGGMEPY